VVQLDDAKQRWPVPPSAIIAECGSGTEPACDLTQSRIVAADENVAETRSYRRVRNGPRCLPGGEIVRDRACAPHCTQRSIEPQALANDGMQVAKVISAGSPPMSPGIRFRCTIRAAISWASMVPRELRNTRRNPRTVIHTPPAIAAGRSASAYPIVRPIWVFENAAPARRPAGGRAEPSAGRSVRNMALGT